MLLEVANRSDNRAPTSDKIGCSTTNAITRYQDVFRYKVDVQSFYCRLTTGSLHNGLGNTGDECPTLETAITSTRQIIARVHPKIEHAVAVRVTVYFSHRSVINSRRSNRRELNLNVTDLCRSHRRYRNTRIRP